MRLQKKPRPSKAKRQRQDAQLLLRLNLPKQEAAVEDHVQQDPLKAVVGVE